MSRGVRDDIEKFRARERECTKPEPTPNCPTRIMDGRNELRCWFLEGHEGDCK